MLLLAGAGGLFALKTCQKQPEGPAPVPSATVAQTASAVPENPKLDDVPPPPPPEEKPEAGPTGPKIVYVQAGGCDSKCSGGLSPELEQALQVRGIQARRCYNSALAQDSSLKGHVAITVKVGASGNVCSANVTGNDMSSPNVANCAANIFRSSSFPAPRGGCAEIAVPLSFIPQGQ